MWTGNGYIKKSGKKDKYTKCENIKRIDYDCKVGEKIMLKNKTVYKYEIIFMGLHEITHIFTNVTIMLRMVTTENK